MPTRHWRTGRIAALAGALLLGAVTGSLPAAEAAPAPPGGQHDWPQFHGPRRDNRSTETGLLKRWPAGGPTLLWKARGLGHGWATVAISGGRLYTAGNVNSRTVITALDLAGKRLWQTTGEAAFKQSTPGARATPTIAGGRLYHLNGSGHVLCLDAQTGKRLWSVNMLARFGGRNIRWGLAESLLVDGQRVICCPGGPKAALAALDAETGKTVWTCTGLDDKPGYVTPILVACGGLRQVITIMANHAVGVSAETGALLWTYEHKVPYEANCVSPVYHDGHVVLAGTWGRGATLLKLTVTGRACRAEEVWRTGELDNEHGGIVLVDGYLYGQADGNHKRRHLACLDMKTGKTMWTARELAGRRSATLTYADGMLYVMSDGGEVALVRPNPKQLDIVSRFTLPKGGKGDAWAHPVICDGHLYIRHGDFLYVYSIRPGGWART